MEPAGKLFNDDDRNLVRRFRSGDEEVFESIVRGCAGRMLATARRILGDEEDARDAVQDAFLSAFRSLDKFEGDARLSTWLHRIAINASLMKLRARQRRPEESIEELLPRFSQEGRMEAFGREWKAPAEGLLEREDIRKMVRQKIGQLPENYRSVLALRDIEQLGTDETAQLLGVTGNAVKIRLHRARQALRTLLAQSFAAEAI